MASTPPGGAQLAHFAVAGVVIGAAQAFTMGMLLPSNDPLKMRIAYSCFIAIAGAIVGAFITVVFGIIFGWWLFKRQEMNRVTRIVGAACLVSGISSAIVLHRVSVDAAEGWSLFVMPVVSIMAIAVLKLWKMPRRAP